MTAIHATDYFRYTNNAPKKKERQEILARVKELGDTEATDTRVNNWFIYVRQKEKTRPSFPPPTSASEPNESKWVDARHKTRKFLIPVVNHFISPIHTLTESLALQSGRRSQRNPSETSRSFTINTLPWRASRPNRLMTFGRKVSVPNPSMCACGVSSKYANTLVSHSQTLFP